MTDELYSMTAAALVEMHDRACRPEDRIGRPWKRSKRELIGMIRALGATHGDERSPKAAEDTATGDAETVGAFVARLLMTEATYAEIAVAARERFDGARTSPRSVASVASGLRRRGVLVPRRRG
ncbi:MAG: hypothetical protein VX529_09595 [Pseudomonadota bacterium]|nr:hypothetical protein [Pseudomonadota bacterium]